MKVIIGLGNPDINYALTRHNFGWRVIDALADHYSVELAVKSKFSALIAETTQNGEKILLVKPLSYYNNSGQVVRALVDFYKLSAADILVIHDELALPLGHVRIRVSGSAAGNNGIKSIIATLGADFARIRLGINHQERHRIPDVDFVLSKFSRQDEKIVDEVITQVVNLASDFVAGKFQADTLTLDQ